MKILSRTRKAPDKTKGFLSVSFVVCTGKWLWNIDQQPYIYKGYICSTLWCIGTDIGAIIDWQIASKVRFFLVSPSVTHLTAASRPQALKASTVHCWHFCSSCSWLLCKVYFEVHCFWGLDVLSLVWSRSLTYSWMCHIGQKANMSGSAASISNPSCSAISRPALGTGRDRVTVWCHSQIWAFILPADL